MFLCFAIILTIVNVFAFNAYDIRYILNTYHRFGIVLFI